MTQTELIDFLGTLPGNQANLSDLSDQMRTGTGVIPFVGAGLSVPHFPLWDKFIRDLAKDARIVNEVEARLKVLEYEEAAELLQTHMGVSFQGAVEDRFGGRAMQGVQPRGAVSLLPHITTGLVITTNFDRLLEKVFEDAGCPFPAKVWNDIVDAVVDSTSRNRRMLLKLHGDVEFPNQRVLTLTEYQKHYGKSKTKVNFRLAIPRALTSLVSRPLLFLGCSLKQDRTGQIITQLGAKIKAIQHYAILEYPENEASYVERIAELDRMHVRPIWYPRTEHSKIEQVLAYLAELVPEPLRLVKKKPDRLPRPGSSFIGRETEQADLRGRIQKYPLVTVVGAPGAGKTRLTIQVARALLPEFDAIWFASLSQFSDVEALPQRIAHIMQLKGQPGKDLLDVVAAALKPGRQMLILDNCETALDECAAIVRKLRVECPELHLVLTSRIDLGNAVEIGSEHLYRVPPLETPDPDRLPDLESLAKIDSVELLLERVKADSDTFRLTEANALKVAQLCKGLDGIALAVELVAAQIDMLSLDSVLKHWDERIDFASTVGAGHQEQQTATLRSTIRLSYDLLGHEANGERLRTLFRRLSVFHRGWMTEAALAVCGELGDPEKDMLALLKPLRRASLIEVEEVAGEKRYRYLDAIREFAFAELAQSGEREAFSARHARWAMEFAERSAPGLLTDQQATCLAKMIGEADNLRGAILFAKQRQDAETALRLTTAIWRVMEIKGFYREGISRLSMALALPGAEKLPVLRSRALSGWSVLAYRQSDLDTAESCSAESLELERQYGDEAGIANALNDLGNVAHLRGEYQKALDLYKETLRIERKRGYDRGTAVALFNCGKQALSLGQLDVARPNLQDALKMFEKAGNRREAAFALNSLGVVARLLGHDEEALFQAGRSLEIRQELEDQRGVAETIRTQAGVLIGKRDFTRAGELLAKSGDIAISIGEERGLVETLEHLSWLNSAQESHGISTLLAAAAAELRVELRLPLPPVDQPARDARLAAAAKALGEQAFAAQWEKGRWTPPEEAFALGVNRKVQAAHTN